MQTETEENYLKAIYHLSAKRAEPVNTSSIAGSLSTTSASVTDMLKKLAEKNLIEYERYRGVRITRKGEKIAINIVRKHRLWEVFLTQTLKFRWDEVHSMAEELEHVSSDELIKRLEEYLGFPRFDPHGDPIPDLTGKISAPSSLTLASGECDKRYTLTGVNDHSVSFLQYLERTGLKPGITVRILEIQEYDHSMQIELKNKTKLSISNDVAKNILVKNYGE